MKTSAPSLYKFKFISLMSVISLKYLAVLKKAEFIIFVVVLTMLFFLPPVAAYASDAEKKAVVSEKNEKKVKIIWYGHSMFRLDFIDLKILIDPYSDIGYPLPLRPIECDVCIVSHAHPDHCNLNIAGGAYSLINSEGVFNARGITVNMIKSYHDRKCGADRGINYISVFEYDNVRFAHLGDLGAYDDGLLKSLGRIDVLMIPVGGYYTIDAYDALEIVRILNPAIVIPMHYKTEKLDKKIPVDTADKFLSGRSNVVYFDNGSCEVKLNSLPREEVTYIFKL